MSDRVYILSRLVSSHIQLRRARPIVFPLAFRRFSHLRTTALSMTADARQLVSEWTHREKYNHQGDGKRLLHANLSHAKAVIKVAAADGKINDATRNWIMGHTAALGASDEVLDLAEKFKPNVEDATVPYHSKSGLEHARLGQPWLFYDAFCAASAGGELSPEKVTAIYAVAKKMQIDEEKIKQVQEMAEKEQQLRQKRQEILFPNGVNQAIKEVREEL